jgi:hypothetical protein
MSQDTASPIIESLNKHGITRLEPLYCLDTIKTWNYLIDLSMTHKEGPRLYLRADELYQLGILKSLLSPELKHLINGVMPDACLYHLHLYESPGLNNKPHIHSENGLNGWHRDDDCLYAWEPNQFHFISFFIYLTDVVEENGPFEISSLKANQPIKAKMPSYKVLGKSGTNFLFDRTFWHRATPNQAINNRRVIKLSFQNRYLFNDRIHLPEFNILKKSNLANDPTIQKWLLLEEDHHEQEKYA